MKINWLDRKIGHHGPYLALVLSQKEYDQAIKHCDGQPGHSYIKTDRAHATAHYLDNAQGELCCIVALGETAGRTGIEIAGLLVHEAVHIWQAWCDSIGEREPAAEQEAYAIQSISQILMAEYARRVAA